MAVEIPEYGFKFRVKNNERSKQLQRAFFHYGFKWGVDKFTVQFTNKPFLYIDSCFFISWGYAAIYFKEYKGKEMTLNQFVNFMEGIRFGYTIYGEKLKISNGVINDS